MDARDINAIGEVLAGGLDGATHRVEEIHHAVAERWFDAVGPVRRVPETIHDRIVAGVYSTFRTVGPAAIRMGALGLGSARQSDAPRVAAGQRGRTAIGVLNGIFGDALARRRNGLALRMTVRQGEHDVPVNPGALREAFPAATPRVAVFIHGFGETDESWRWFSQAHWQDEAINYGLLLARQLGFTPVYLRYNTGRPMEHNARELSELLDELVRSWPAGVGELVLLGHSYGALIAHLAVQHGYSWDSTWVERTSHVFTLGTPRGAEFVERLTLKTGQALSSLPETRPLARLLDARSAGLKDLAERAMGHLPAGIEDVRLPNETLEVSHFRLLNHPAIYAEIKARLSARIAPAPARAARGARFERAAKALRSRTRSRRR
jgi:pimeloyl-ACP methyl ester carboxylesterase